MVVDVLAVGMRGNEKGVSALCPAQGGFVAHPVCLLRGNLPRYKGLPDLVAQHVGISLLLSARDGLVLCLGKQELGVGGQVVALVAGDQFSAPGLVRVLPIVKTIPHRLSDGFPLADMVGNKACCGRGRSPFL